MPGRRGRILLATATVAAAVGTASATAREPAPQDPDGPNATGRLIVDLATPSPPTGESAAADQRRRKLAERAGELGGLLAARHSLRVPLAIPAGGLITVAPGPGETTESLRRELARDPLVEGVFIEYTRKLHVVPNDPAFNRRDPREPYGDYYQWYLRKAGFRRAWNFSKGKKGRVAVIDTGVQGDHPELVHRIIRAVDWDPRATGALHDETGHGTQTAGLACADSNNGVGMASAGFDCQLIVEKAHEIGPGELTDGSIIAAIYDATNRGADVISMSFGGGGPNPAMAQAIDYAWSRNVVLVAAAENRRTGVQGFPARYLQPERSSRKLRKGKGLVVTMANYFGKASGGGFGSGVSLGAYGDSFPPFPGIFATWPGDRCGIFEPPPCPPGTSFFGDRRYSYQFGTSLAVPMVAGVAALIRSAKPRLPAGKINRFIKATARRRKKKFDFYGLAWGLLDATAAVARARGIDITPPRSRAILPKGSTGAGFKLKIHSRDPSPLGRVRSGVKYVNVYVAEGRGRFQFLLRTRKKSVILGGRPGSTYSFFTVAVDKNNNRERPPRRADAVVKIV